MFLQQGLDGRMDPSLLNHAVLSSLGSHMQTLEIYELSFDQNYYTFAFILAIKIAPQPRRPLLPRVCPDVKRQLN